MYVSMYVFIYKHFFHFNFSFYIKIISFLSTYKPPAVFFIYPSLENSRVM